RRLLPRRCTAGAVRGGAALSHPGVVPGVGVGEQPPPGRSLGARARASRGRSVGARRRSLRPGVDRARRRHARLAGAALAERPRMTMSADLWPYLLLLLVGFLPNEIWRWLGIVLARGLDESAPVVVWVRAVATAVLGGVIARIVLVPPGALA